MSLRSGEEGINPKLSRGIKNKGVRKVSSLLNGMFLIEANPL